MSNKVRVLDLFGGIGGFRLGLDNAMNIKVVKYIEKDKHAVKSYNKIFGENHEARNIKEVDAEDIPDHDILCAGFPCQAFSLAGKRGGFRDTRGTMFFEIARIAKEKLPKILFLENVKGLLNHSNGKTFATILQTLDELGYDAEWQVLNSKHFGVPQNRERVFIIGHLRGETSGQVFPIKGYDKEDSKEVEGKEPEQVSEGDGLSYAVDSCYHKGGLLSMIKGNRCRRTHIINHQFRPKSRPSIQNGQSGGSGILASDEHCFTISTSPHYVNNKGDSKIRKLTPKECWRLQGFPDWAFGRANKVNSDTQLYRQAGNAVTVNVIEEIGSRIKQVI